MITLVTPVMSLDGYHVVSCRPWILSLGIRTTRPLQPYYIPFIHICIQSLNSHSQLERFMSSVVVDCSVEGFRI